MREVCAEAYAQYTSNVQRTFCTIENTTESHSAISYTFHNVVEKRNPHQSEDRCRRRKEGLFDWTTV